MKHFTLFTDPHIGTRRQANTTRKSSEKLSRKLYDKAVELSSMPNAVCGGDLFDRAFNDETTIVQGFFVANNCMAVLAGNHDETNRDNTTTSLHVLKEAGCPIVSSPDLTQPHFYVLDDAIYLIPHHASQRLFEEAVEQASFHAAQNREGKPAVLILHCNYNCGFAEEDDTLNLSVEQASKATEAFDYLFLGHEHQPTEHLDGKVVVLGNSHPTSFSDISDKYYYELRISDSEIEVNKVLSWNKAEKYRSVEFGSSVELAGVEFVDVVGAVSEGSGPEVARYVQSLWSQGEDLLAVRNNVTIGTSVVTPSEATFTLTDIRDRISSDLEGSDLQPLFKQLLSEVEK